MLTTKGRSGVSLSPRIGPCFATRIQAPEPACAAHDSSDVFPELVSRRSAAACASGLDRRLTSAARVSGDIACPLRLARRQCARRLSGSGILDVAELPRWPRRRPTGSHSAARARRLARPPAVSVGVRPTFGDDLIPLLEVHILDFTGCLYLYGGRSRSSCSSTCIRAEVELGRGAGRPDRGRRRRSAPAGAGELRAIGSPPVAR